VTEPDGTTPDTETPPTTHALPAADTTGDGSRLRDGRAPRDVPLGRNRDFKVVLVSQGASAVGDAVSFTALPLLVFALTGSGLVMGIVGALQTLPDLLFGMVAGAMADRGDRKRMMFLADLGRAGLTALIPLSVLLEGPTLAVILLVSAPLSLLRTFFLAAYTASVPTLVGRSQITQANSYFEAIYSTGYIVGPAIAGILSSTIGPGPTLAIDAATFALSGLGLMFIRRDLRAPADRVRDTLLAEIREGVAFIAGHGVLRASIVFWGMLSILTAPLVAALTVHVTRDLGLEDAVLGFVLAAYGGGTVLSALVTARIPRRPVAPFLLGGTIITGALLLGVAVASSVPLLLAVSALAGISQSAVFLTYISLRTVLSPDALLGRIGSTARTLSLGLQPIGLLVGGVLIDLTSGSTTIIVMGAALIVLSIAFFAIADLRHATLRVSRAG
jgi:ENTS family enterobactin (siderophore) exporter